MTQVPHAHSVFSTPVDNDRLREPDVWLARRIVQFVQDSFRDVPVGSFRFTNDESSEIWITDELPLGRSVLSRRPALQISLGGFQAGNVGLDQRLSYNIATGERQHVELYHAQLTVHVHARSADTVKRLARMVCRMIQEQRHVLLRVAELHYLGPQISVSGLSPPGALLQGAGEMESVLTSVTVPFGFVERWSARPQLIPFGDSGQSGTGPRPGVAPEDLPAARQLMVSASMVTTDGTESLSRMLRVVRENPPQAPTIRGRRQIISTPLDPPAGAPERLRLRQSLTTDTE